MKLFQALEYLYTSRSLEFLRDGEKVHSALKDLCIDDRNERDEADLYCKIDGAVGFFQELLKGDELGENRLIARYSVVKNYLSKDLYVRFVQAMSILAKTGKAIDNPPSLQETEQEVLEKRPVAKNGDTDHNVSDYKNKLKKLGEKEKPFKAPTKTPAPTQPKPTPSPNPPAQNVQSDAGDGWIVIPFIGVICIVLALITSWVCSWFIAEVGWNVWQWLVGIFGGIFSIALFAGIAMTTEKSKAKFLHVVCLALIMAVNCALKIALGEVYAVVYVWFSVFNAVSAFSTLGFSLDENEEIHGFWGWLSVVLLVVSAILLLSCIGNAFGCNGFFGCFA